MRYGGTVTIFFDAARAPLRRIATCMAIAGLLGACGRAPAVGETDGAEVMAAGAVASTPLDDAEATYPPDITPPAGTQYPCALTALPRDLPGVPAAERRYINRTYARVLRATQAKLVALRAIEHEPTDRESMETYQTNTQRLRRALAADRAPSGLEDFQRDVTAALELQQTFFRRAVEVRLRGGGMAEVYAVPEGRDASARLIQAFGRMQNRYPAWSAETRDSIYHHLCALDLF